jgi:hypothetical protein
LCRRVAGLARRRTGEHIAAVRWLDSGLHFGQSARVTDSPRPPFIRHSDGSTSEGRRTAPQPNVLDRVCGLGLSWVRIDHQTRLQFGEFEIVIESPFCLTAPNGTEHSLDPDLRASLGPVLDLYPDALSAATVDAAASLWLRFASGAIINIPADFGFEAWQVNGPNGFLVVCEAGEAGLSVWGGPEE